MNVPRVQYLVYTNLPKQDGKPLDQKDLVDLGYMAGRFGIDLDGKAFKHKIPDVSLLGTKIDINACTCDLFEDNLKKSGISFNKIA